ncbi:hypothetical protein QFZ33_000231 [Arthrobacter globiformis]|nr:hypothetical protein [Arthrobacter globiformis]
MCPSLAIGSACKAPAGHVLGSYTADGGLSALYAIFGLFTEGTIGGSCTRRFAQCCPLPPRLVWPPGYP